MERYWIEDYLRADRLPHMWCSGCGIGIAVGGFLRAIYESKIPPDKIAVISGIGCSGRVAGYAKFDSIHVTHGRPVPFATGLKLANPEIKVVVFSGDGDLFAIGGNHIIHAARRNIDIMVVCVNNFNYAMTGGQVGPTTPMEALTTTTPHGNFEEPFNLPYIMDSCGAVYIARWTTYHAVQLTKSLKEALLKKGFSFIEIISPCPTLFGRKNKIGGGLDEMKYYKKSSVIRHGASTKEVKLSFRGEITVGKFVDRDRPTFQEIMHQHYRKVLGEEYMPYQVLRV
jgi:2-oxoglutarate ferredoxin oxidoreductase subunit beta